MFLGAQTTPFLGDFVSFGANRLYVILILYYIYKVYFGIELMVNLDFINFMFHVSKQNKKEVFRPLLHALMHIYKIKL